MNKLEELKEQVRQTPLSERLEMARRMIGKMCSEKRPPKMSIPVHPTDEDFFITRTLEDAITALAVPKQKCGICGGKTVFIRGRYPKQEQRPACPTCAVERLEQIRDISADHYGQPASADSGNSSGRVESSIPA